MALVQSVAVVNTITTLRFFEGRNFRDQLISYKLLIRHCTIINSYIA